jgi:hypothetical protein
MAVICAAVHWNKAKKTLKLPSKEHITPNEQCIFLLLKIKKQARLLARRAVWQHEPNQPGKPQALVTSFYPNSMGKDYYLEYSDYRFILILL